MSKVLKNFVGIDISKPYFDAALIKASSPGEVIHQQFSQQKKGFLEFINWLMEHDVKPDEETLICMEYTGLYNGGLVNYLVQRKALLWVEMPLRIKRSGGFERGGSDKASSVKIAFYALRFQDRMQLWRPIDSSIEKIKNLIAQRDRIVSTIKQLTVPINELIESGQEKEAGEMEKLQRSPLKALQKTKEAIELLIMKVVQLDETVNKKMQQIMSIKGIGHITAATVLAYTKGFTSFSNGKQLACYCGVAPFAKSSGISVRFKSSVSPHANKKLKKLLHLCAMSAANNDPFLKAYYERKVAEGKNRMSVLNAVRNKLIHRIFALIRDDRYYEDNYVRKCA